MTLAKSENPLVSKYILIQPDFDQDGEEIAAIVSESDGQDI